MSTGQAIECYITEVVAVERVYLRFPDDMREQIEAWRIANGFSTRRIGQCPGGRDLSLTAEKELKSWRGPAWKGEDEHHGH